MEGLLTCWTQSHAEPFLSHTHQNPPDSFLKSCVVFPDFCLLFCKIHSQIVKRANFYFNTVLKIMPEFDFLETESGASMLSCCVSCVVCVCLSIRGSAISTGLWTDRRSTAASWFLWRVLKSRPTTQRGPSVWEKPTVKRSGGHHPKNSKKHRINWGKV